MLGQFIPATRQPREEGENPFWISYSDLMTALTVLFLVVMSVSLLTITQELLEKNDKLEAQKVELERQRSELQKNNAELEQRRRESEEKNARLEAQRRELEEKNARLEAQRRELEKAKREVDTLKAKRTARQQAIDRVMDRLQAAADSDAFRGRISVGRDRMVIDFGEAARFSSGNYRLTREGATLLRSFVPVLLEAVDSYAGRQWFRRIVVEGFTDTDGSYLYNLDLSLKRAQSVVCALMDTTPYAEARLSPEQQRRVRDLFLVGGFSFNSAKASKEDSRRVELRLVFQTVEEHENGASEPMPLGPVEVGKCQLN